ncbi:MAG: DNA-binding protein, partial [Clostridium sp.]|nr:DNA-binding protein [Clostridium sp.]
FVLKDKNNLSQISFIEIDSKEKKDIKKTSKKNLVTKKNTKNENNKLKKDEEKIKDIANKKVNKKDRKINLTQEDIDKLCEVYDWYLQVRDNKNMKPKKIISNKKDINIEEKELKELKSTSIKVDKSTWEDFERLCSNSNFSKQQIITQALKDFMKEYKHLL